MAFVILGLPFVMVAAVLGRWTRAHPLAIGALLAVAPALLAMLAMAGFFADGATILLVGAIAFIIVGAAAAMSAWMGRLRRQHVERIGS